MLTVLPATLLATLTPSCRAPRMPTDEELHPQIRIDGGFALRFRQAAHGVDVVRLDAIEVVFSLGVDGAEDGVGVRLAGDVRDTPVIANDCGVSRFPFPTRCFGSFGIEGASGRQKQGQGCGVKSVPRERYLA